MPLAPKPCPAPQGVFGSVQPTAPAYTAQRRVFAALARLDRTGTAPLLQLRLGKTSTSPKPFPEVRKTPAQRKAKSSQTLPGSTPFDPRPRACGLSPNGVFCSSGKGFSGEEVCTVSGAGLPQILAKVRQHARRSEQQLGVGPLKGKLPVAHQLQRQ